MEKFESNFQLLRNAEKNFKKTEMNKDTDKEKSFVCEANCHEGKLLNFLSYIHNRLYKIFVFS